MRSTSAPASIRSASRENMVADSRRVERPLGGPGLDPGGAAEPSLRDAGRARARGGERGWCDGATEGRTRAPADPVPRRLAVLPRGPDAGRAGGRQPGSSSHVRRCSPSASESSRATSRPPASARAPACCWRFPTRRSRSIAGLALNSLGAPPRSRSPRDWGADALTERCREEQRPAGVRLGPRRRHVADSPRRPTLRRALGCWTQDRGRRGERRHGADRLPPPGGRSPRRRAHNRRGPVAATRSRPAGARPLHIRQPRAGPTGSSRRSATSTRTAGRSSSTSASAPTTGPC